MDWLKHILQSLPLDKISDILGEIVIWWSQMVKDIPPADLPMYAYLGGAVLVLILWILVARMLPRPLGGMSWMVLFAVLLAPGTALGDQSLIAPASISVVYAVMMKDMAGAVTNALPILVVLVVGLFIGFVWQLIRGAFEASLDRARRRTAEDTQANLQLATGNYLTEDTAITEKIVEKEPLPIVMLKKSGLKKNITQPMTHEDGVLNTDIHSPKDSALRKNPIEGFYTKKTPKESVATVDHEVDDPK